MGGGVDVEVHCIVLADGGGWRKSVVKFATAVSHHQKRKASMSSSTTTIDR